MSRDDLLLVAGEASGDLHAARLLTEIRRLRPQVRAFGFGGGEVRAAGLEAVSDEDIAVVGIVEVLKVLKKAKQVFRQILEEVDRRRPAVAVLVDFPEFNLRLAKELSARGVKVVYYISPQIWAWRRGRVRQIAQRVDRMLVLFPFELDFYRGHGVDARHVGHPLVDEVPELAQAWEESSESQPKVPEEAPYRLALLPGSRPGEVASLLPAMLEAAELMAREVPLFVRLVRAPTISEELVRPILERSKVPVEVVGGAGSGGAQDSGKAQHGRFDAVADSHLAFCASGTATLETGLLRTPLIVLYRLSLGSYLLAKMLVRLPFFSLVNLVLERRVVPELLQHQASPEGAAREALALLRDRRAVDEMRRGLTELRPRLGERGASSRAARAVLEMVEGGATENGSTLAGRAQEPEPVKTAASEDAS
ncbi:MAG: lipid-A-disaccharide synthase [Acidobacteriota bacterium]|nr:lipid-A-disaccharide synthase [Acidobacteriota bacterium]